MKLAFAISAFLLILPGFARAAEVEASKFPSAEKFEELLKGATVLLQDALQTGERKGMPVLGGYELEDGDFHYSIISYRAELKRWTEVEINPYTGKAKAEKLEADEIKADQSYADIMAKASLALRSATRRALKTNPGWTAIKVTPFLQDGHPHANVLLQKGKEQKTVPIKID